MRIINIFGNDAEPIGTNLETVHIRHATKRLIRQSDAIILSIDEALLNSPHLNEVLEMLTQRKAHRFRCYLYPRDRTPQEFWDWLQRTCETNPYWAAFNDIYHLDINRIADEYDLEKALSTLRREYSNESKYAFYSFTTASIRLTLSLLCIILQVVAVSAFSIHALLNLPVLSKILPPQLIEYFNSFILPYSEHYETLAFFGGWTIMVFSYSYNFLYMRGGIQGARTYLAQYSRNRFDPAKSYVLLFIAVILGFNILLQNNFATTLLWVLLAFMIDAIRRQRFTALKRFTSIRINKDNYCKTDTAAKKLIARCI